jgi:hypothetical protein
MEKLVIKEHYINDKGRFMLTHDNKLLKIVTCNCNTCDAHKQGKGGE